MQMQKNLLLIVIAGIINAKHVKSFIDQLEGNDYILQSHWCIAQRQICNVN